MLIFEFFSIEHTLKNNMIVGTKKEKKFDVEKLKEQIISIKKIYRIRNHKVESLLKT